MRAHQSLKSVAVNTENQWPIWPNGSSPLPPAIPMRSRPAIIALPFRTTDVEPVAASPTFQTDLINEVNLLRRYALWLCNNPSLADDIIQDTLLKAWLARERFEPGTNLKAWCTTILRNVFFSYKRRSWRMLPLADEAMASILAQTADCGAALDLLAVRNLIALLPQDQRDALLLVGVGGMSYADAADICSCAVGTVKSRVSRARLRLAILLEENKAGFNSDSSISAAETLDDLMEQVAQITLAAKAAKEHGDVSGPDVKHSGPASSPERMLATV